MKVEIDNIKEVKEVVITSEGNINFIFPEYPGYIAKIVVLDQKASHTQIYKLQEEMYRDIEDSINRIEGKKYKKGHKRSRQTAKEFSRLVSKKFEIRNKTQSWITLKNETQIRFSSSVVYQGEEADYLWYSISYNDIIEHLKNKLTYLAFIIMESYKMIYLDINEVINEFKKAKELRNSDWLHIYFIFSNENIIFQIKTGKGNLPLEKEFPREERYIKWEKFIKLLEK